MSENYLPEQFEINYKHEINGTKSIKLLNNTFLVNDPNPELIDVNRLESEKWIQFWEDLEKIGLWDLEEEYQGCTLDGGFTWKIEISYQNKELNSYDALGIWSPHQSNSTTEYITIDELERRTGIDFFCNLPDAIERQVEATVDEDYWSVKVSQ